MDFVIGDAVRLIAVPEQTGIIVRLHPLSVGKSFVVKMNQGPLYNDGEFMGYFGHNISTVEVYIPA
jgi:hypothetical protein